MEKPDQLTQHLSNSRRVASAADGPNLMQRAVNAFSDRRQVMDGDGPIDFSRAEQDWKAKRDYDRQTRLPGAATFERGSMLSSEKQKG